MQYTKFLWLIVCLSCVSCRSAAQQPESRQPVIRENERGERIIVFPDGRWQYFHRYSQGDGTLFDPGDNPERGASDQLDRYPVFTGKVVPFEEEISVTEEDARKIGFRNLQLARSATAIAEERATEARRQRERLETELANTRQRTPNSESVHQLELRLEAARRTETETARELRLAQTEITRAETSMNQGNLLAELRASLQQKAPGNAIVATGDPNDQFYLNAVSIDKVIAPGERQNSPLIHPPAPACQIDFQGLDEFTGMQRRDVGKQLLFTHTDERLRLYLKEKDYLRCEGFMTSLAGGFRYLTLEYTFAYPNAREAYGFIEKGSYLVIHLLDGQSIYLQSGKMDTGSYDIKRELLTYRVNYPINQNVINTLRRGEVDSIRMYWSSGFEEYDVYNLTFFIDQIRCLEQ